MGDASKVPWGIAFALHIVCFIFCVIAFGTNHWYEPREHTDDNQFGRIGLWEVCFDGYEHTSDYIGKQYYGCWWIYHKEYSYIREWLMPPWFIAVQTLMTFAVVLLLLLFPLMPMSVAMEKHSRRQLTCVLIALQTCCIGISVTVFAVMIGEDRTWMPRWDMNKLSWSFGLATVSGFFSMFELMAFSTYTFMCQYERDAEKYRPTYKQGKPGMPY